MSSPQANVRDFSPAKEIDGKNFLICTTYSKPLIEQDIYQNSINKSDNKVPSSAQKMRNFDPRQDKYCKLLYFNT